MKILAINPGSTSTKIAVFEDTKPVFTKTLRHSNDEISQFKKIYDQFDFRKKIIIDTLKEENIAVDSLDAVVGRGGLVKPIPGGVYAVNDIMVEDLSKGLLGEHASNLGGILANEISKESGKNIPAFIVDPVVVDEMQDVARISGHPAIQRICIFHALNQKAVARRYCRENNLKYEDINLVIAHMGGGITVGSHEKGKVIDVNNGIDGDGAFSPDRSGSLPAYLVAKLCFSGKYTLQDIKKMINGNGGMAAYLNTNNAIEVEKRVEAGDKEATLVYEAMAYQVAKEIGAAATVLQGDVKAILITGGLAYSKQLTDWITERVKFIAPVNIYPGEDEMQALAENTYYALKGEYPIKEYK